MTTQVKIEKIGGQFVLPLSAELVGNLEIEDDSVIEITTSDKKIVLRTLTVDERRQEFTKLKDEMFDKYSRVFEALAEGAK